MDREKKIWLISIQKFSSNSTNAMKKLYIYILIKIGKKKKKNVTNREKDEGGPKNRQEFEWW